MKTAHPTAAEASGGGPVDYRALFEAMPAPSVILAPPGFVMVAANQPWLRITDTRPENVIGRKLFDVFPEMPTDPQGTGENDLRASLERLLARGRPDAMPVQRYDVRGPDGGLEERWWAPVNIPVLGPDGAVRYIIHQVEDVTNEVLERRRATAAEAGAARFREVADAIPGLVFEADRQAKNTYVNESFRTYTGLPFASLLGFGWGKVLHPEDRDRTAAGWLQAMQSARPFEGEARIRRADGEWRWFLVRATPLKGADGRAERGIGVCTDIEDAKRGEAALRELEQLQRTLLQEVSHRVKNSLALVSSVLNLQARSADNGARASLQEAALRVHAVARVHDQLWRGAGTREIDLQPFLCDLCSAIGGAAPLHATVCSAEPAIVAAEFAAPLGLFINELLTNAYKHAYPDGQGGEVRLLGSKLPDGRYRLEVADSGRGLPADFDLAKSRDSLGIRVITSLAAQLGGQLAVGTAGPGARFTLVFPLKPG